MKLRGFFFVHFTPTEMTIDNGYREVKGMRIFVEKIKKLTASQRRLLMIIIDAMLGKK